MDKFPRSFAMAAGVFGVVTGIAVGFWTAIDTSRMHTQAAGEGAVSLVTVLAVAYLATLLIAFFTKAIRADAGARPWIGRRAGRAGPAKSELPDAVQELAQTAQTIADAAGSLAAEAFALKWKRELDLEGELVLQRFATLKFDRLECPDSLRLARAARKQFQRMLLAASAYTCSAVHAVDPAGTAALDLPQDGRQSGFLQRKWQALVGTRHAALRAILRELEVALARRV